MPDDPLSDLPEPELDIFLMTVTDAVELALDGEITSGFRCLCGGMARARELQSDGEAWATELVRRYREALDRYTERYGEQLMKGPEE